MKRNNAKINDQKGFTLIELIVVLVILGVLAAITVPSLMGYFESTQVSACELSRQNLKTAYESVVATERNSGIEPTEGTFQWEAMDALKLAGHADLVQGNVTIISDVTLKVTGICGDNTYTLRRNASSDGKSVSLSVFCSKKGHGSTNLQYQQANIADWLNSYSGTKSGNTLVQDYVKEHGESYALTADDYEELFGNMQISNDYNNGQLYLRPMGVRVNGVLQDVQYVGRWNEIYNKPGEENMRSYAIIVNGKVYVSTLNGKLAGVRDVHGVWIPKVAAENYTSIEQFVTVITQYGDFHEIGA